MTTFNCQSVKKSAYSGLEYEFYAVCNDGTPENDRFHNYISSGKITIMVDNPNVVFEPGKVYYVHFSEAV